MFTKHIVVDKGCGVIDLKITNGLLYGFHSRAWKERIHFFIVTLLFWDFNTTKSVQDRVSVTMGNSYNGPFFAASGLSISLE